VTFSELLQVVVSERKCWLGGSVGLLALFAPSSWVVLMWYAARSGTCVGVRGKKLSTGSAVARPPNAPKYACRRRRSIETKRIHGK
jgi:hypothetical protein